MPFDLENRKLSYLKLLHNNEFNVLKGKRGINLLILSGILLLSLGSISAGLGIFINLRDKMDNPFTNWVDLAVLGSYQDTIRSMEDYMSRPEKKEQYNIKNLIQYNKKFEYFYKPVFPEKYRKFMVRSMDYQEDLFEKVLEKSNRVFIDPGFIGERPVCDFMISREAFDEMELEWNDDRPLTLALEYNDQVMEVRVGAVLKNLPDRAEFLCSTQMMYLLFADSNVDRFFDTGDKKELNYVAQKLQEEPDFEFPGFNFVSFDSENFVLNGRDTMVRYTFYFNDFLNESQREEIDSVLKKRYKLNCQPRLIWNCRSFGTQFNRPQYVAINFSDLRNIRKFKEELKERFDIDLEMSEVEDKENFSNVTLLVTLATIGLALMGVACFLLFIYFLISDHFDKIKQNLGTFLAFGFSRDELIRVYVRIVLRLIFYAMMISLIFLLMLKFPASWIIGYDYLRIFHPVTIGFVLLYAVCGFLLVRWRAGRILSHAPGDLIYNRK